MWSPMFRAARTRSPGCRAPRRIAIFVAALVAWAGIFAIHPLHGMEELAHVGFISGIAASFAISGMALCVKRLIMQGVSHMTVTFAQLIGAVCFSLPIAAMRFSGEVALTDIGVILFLGVICSALGQTLFNSALRVVRISTASIVSSMETPYGILISFLLRGTPITLPVVAGTTLVTIAAVIVSISPRKGGESYLEPTIR